MSLHFDQAREQAIAASVKLAADDPLVAKLVVLDDLYGRIRLVVWREDGPASPTSQWTITASAAMQEAAGNFWSGDIWNAVGGGAADAALYEQTWAEASQSADCPKVRVLDRHRYLGSWFVNPTVPADPHAGNAKTVVFYSFKGGVGRTTALAAFALARAAAGQRVVVVDFDLDAPGASSLFAPDSEDEGARWGVVDYLLEHKTASLSFSDYFHKYNAPQLAGDIYCVPAGRLDILYINKLARIDLEPHSFPNGGSDVESLLTDISRSLQPDWILVDARPGLSNPAGVLLSGHAHLYVLFGTASEQSWSGLRLAIERLGAQRVQHSQFQGDCVLAHAMIPEVADLSDRLQAEFRDRAEDEFRDHYYVDDSADTSDVYWSLSDLGTSDAPHVPVAIHYTNRLVGFSCIGHVAEYLLESPDHKKLCQRILSRFEREAE